MTTTEVLTLEEVCQWLRLSKRQIYEMTRQRTREKSSYPLPVLRLGSSLRFSKPAIENWLQQIAQGEGQ